MMAPRRGAEGGAVGSRRRMVRAGVAVLLLAAVVVVVAVPGIGKWIVAAVLAGLASALGGLVARSADKVITRGRDAVLAPTPSAPLIVMAYQTPGLSGHIGPVPEDLEARRNSTGWVDLGSSVVHLTVEATVERAVILSKLDIRVESRCAPPRIDEVEPPPMAEPMSPEQLRTFHVDLSDQTPVPRPAHGVPDFPYTVSHLDPEHFFLRVTSGTPGDVTWRVGVHWLCNGQSGVVIADREGQPFRLVKT